MASQETARKIVLRAEGATDVGRVRDHNEDYYLLAPEYRLFLLADGMGGHNAGEVASRVALEAAQEFFARSIEQADNTWPYPLRKDVSLEGNRLVAALRAANTRVLEESQASRDRAGMGTTIVGLAFADGEVNVAHMGDSRVYRIRRGKIEQLTDDHSLVAEQLRSGLLSRAEADASPYKNVITRACGIREGVVPDIRVEKVESGDVYLMCSDGLSNLIPDKVLMTTVNEAGGDLAKAARALIAAANEAGGDDNITVLLVRVESAG